MSNTCPCCKRRMPTPRVTVDKRIVQDQAKVEAALASCDAALTNPWFADLWDAIRDEKSRLYRALVDHRLLWALYRRADKKAPYYEVA